MKDQPHTQPIDPELEARVAALVLGESSDFEREQLQRLIEQRPELAALKQQIEGIDGLLQDVGAGDPIADDEDWKLSPERRRALIAAISGETIGEAEQQRALPALTVRAEDRQSNRERWLWNLSRIAAVFCLVGICVAAMVLPGINAAREVARRPAADATAPPLLQRQTLSQRLFGETSAPESRDSMKKSGQKLYEDFDAEQDSDAALSTLGDNLEMKAELAAPNVLMEDRYGLGGESQNEYAFGGMSGAGGYGGGLAVDEDDYGRRGESLGERRAKGIVTNGIAGKSLRSAYPMTQPPASAEMLDDSAGVPTVRKQFKFFDATEFDSGIAESLPSPSDQPVGDQDNLNRQDSLADIPALSSPEGEGDVAGERLPSQYRENVREYWQRIEDDQKQEQVSSLQRQLQLDTAGTHTWAEPGPPALTGSLRSWYKAPANKAVAAGLDEKLADQEAFSTFSLHVSDVSFKLAQAALAEGEWPEASKVRIEEFVNAFDYGDPLPRAHEQVTCRLEQAAHPFLQQRNLMRVSMRTAAAGRASTTPLRLTFLLDNSGSMERLDRQQTLRRAFALLAGQLGPIDQVTLISFARQPRLLADRVSGAKSAELVKLIDGLPSEGGTNIEAALALAFEKAKEQQVEGAQNRIILITDGAVNLGDADPESLARMITGIRRTGIAFDAAGICAEGLNDEVLEALTRKGDGRYYLLDSVEAADDGFARQIAGALRPSAKNVKVQVEFNPRRVGRYKLLGFEKHRLKQEDFRNDKVDAAEMAAAEAGVAVYQFEARPDGVGDVGSVSVRFRDLSTGRMIENRWPIPYDPDAPRLDQAAPSMRLAASAALLAAKLRGEPLAESVDLKTLSNLIATLPEQDRRIKRVEQLQQMIEQARQVSGD